MTPEFKAYASQIRKNAVTLATCLKVRSLLYLLLSCVESLLSQGHGYKLVTDGTDNHLVLWDLRPIGLTGSKMQKLFDEVRWTMFWYVIYHESQCGCDSASPWTRTLFLETRQPWFQEESVLVCTSLPLLWSQWSEPTFCCTGTPALTSRGLTEKDFEKVGDFLHRGVQIALRIQVSPYTEIFIIVISLTIRIVQTKVGKALKDFVHAMEGDEEIIALRKEVEAFATGFPMPGLWNIKFRGLFIYGVPMR